MQRAQATAQQASVILPCEPTEVTRGPLFAAAPQQVTQQPHQLSDNEAQRCVPRSHLPVSCPCGANLWEYFWDIDEKVLRSKSSRAASPEVELLLPGLEPTKFLLMLHPVRTGTGHNRSSFRSSKGCGRISVKCNGGPLAASSLGVALWLETGEQMDQPALQAAQFRYRVRARVLEVSGRSLPEELPSGSSVDSGNLGIGAS